MAEDNVRKIKTTTVKVDEDKLQKVRETNEQLNQITYTLGQAHTRKLGLKKEIANLEEQIGTVNESLEELLAELEKEYPSGNLDLQTGVITVNEVVNEEDEEEK